MVDQVIKDTFLNIYRDDYRDSDNYYKILFNNGRALQQRELNQMQTILNKDINAISSYTFKPGAAVIGGGQSCRESRWVRLDTSSTGIALPDDPTVLEGGIFQEEVSLIKVRIEKVSLATEADPTVLIFVTYIDDASTESEEVILLTPGRTLNGQGDLSGTNLKITATDTASSPARGKGVLFTVNRGRFYVEDHFVFSESQTIVVSRYIVNPKATIGWKVVEDIVKASDNEDLYDNSGPNPNIAAPGADRYRIRLQLIKKIDTVDTDFFIPIAEVEEGKITIAQVKNNPLAALGDQLALRTYDESGDYAIARTKLTVEDYPGDTNKFYVVADRSTMYVRGYRVQVSAPTKLTVDRPRTADYIKTYTNEVSVATYGNYVKVDLLKGAAPVATFGTVNISSSTTDASSNIIGTARVRAVEEYDNTHRVFLFDIQMVSPNAFTSARSIGTGNGTSSTFFGRITLGPGNNAELYDRKNNNLFFSLKNIRPKEFQDVSYNRQVTATDTTDGSGDLTINTSNAWSNTEAWIIVRNDTGAVLSPNITVSSGAQAATIETGVATTSVTVLAYEQVSFPGISGVRSKTLTQTTLSGATSSSNVTLGKADVHELVSVIDTDTGNDVTSRYTLDTGQRENFYDRGSIRLRAGQAQPTGPLNITFKYFAHGSGGFFAVSSYKNINYSDIPSFRQSNGETLNLRNVLDFRPVMNDAGTGFTGTGGSINLLPRNNDLITLDISYYVGKKGLVYAHSNGYLGTIWSRPGIDSFPECPDHAMIIAKATIPPYMLDNEDIKFKYVDNRRYTMRDIGKIEKRLDTLEEVTSLTLLENKTISTDVLDANGLNRFKAGITADNFIDHRLSDISSPDYKASIDAINADLRPTFTTQSIDLVYSQDASVNVIRKGDNVYIAYVHTDYKSQEAASREVPVNEFAITKSVGDVKLSPASDNWVDTVNLPTVITDAGTVISRQYGQVYNEWNTNWSGVNVETAGDLQPGDIFDVEVNETTNVTDLDVTGVRLSETQKSETVTTVASNSVVTETIGNFLMAEHTIQWMRPRIVSFRITGLRPNSQHFFFFNDVSIDQYVSSTPGAGAYIPVGSLATDSPYRQSTPYFGLTQYPADLGGPTATHLTDANGAISGFFLVPNNDTHRFSTGTQRFAVYDISLPIAGDTLSMAATTYMAAGLIREYEERKVTTRHVSLAVNTELSSSSAISVIPGWTPIEPVVNNYEYITNNDYITNEITNNITNEFITNITEITEVTNVTNEITEINNTYYPTTKVPIVKEVIKEVPIEVPVDRPIETIVYVPNPVSPTPTPVIQETSCFVKGTMVTMADGTKKKIEDIQIGELLLGQDGATNTVMEFDHPPLRGRDLIGINNMGAFMTPEHPVYTKNGWRSYSAETFARQFPDTFHRSLNVKDLKIGDEILKSDGSWMLVESLEVYSDEEEQQVYNFILDGNHTYFANDLLVHNRAGDGDVGADCGVGNDFGGGDIGTCGPGDGGGGGGGGGGCVIATHAVASGKFTTREKAVAVAWCERTLHDKWWGDIIRRGYRYLGRQKIADGQAHKYYQDFKDYVDFGRGKKRTIKNGIKFVSYTTRFFVAGLLFAKKDD